ncbi:MAG: hypothetical protein Q7T50_06470, partial [Candidatus Magasanikbacteria bacterium]|nr:hypothetical protein [Candidatus Magasanikbacteria bacterium]
LYNYFGYNFLVFVFAILSTFAVVILVGKIDYLKFVAIVLGARLALSNLAVRPHSTSFLFFAILILLLEKRFFTTKRHILFWLLFFTFWANVHRGFVVGIGVFSVYLAIDYLYKKSFGKKTKIVVPIFCVLAAVAGSFLTPFSLELYKTGVASDFLSFENLWYIAEWQSVVLYFPNNIYFAATGIIYIYIFLTKAKKLEPVWFVIAALLFALAFISSNFVFFWCALFIFLSSKYLNIDTKNRLIRGALFIFGVGFLVYVSVYTFIEIKKYAGSSVEAVLVKSEYPVQAVKYMRENSIRSNLLNLFNWGGYLLWQYPEAKVFIDGRMASWKTPEGKSILGLYVDLKSGKCEALKDFKVETLLVSKTFDLSCFTNFREVYRDDIAKVLVRKE